MYCMTATDPQTNSHNTAEHFTQYLCSWSGHFLSSALQRQNIRGFHTFRNCFPFCILLKEFLKILSPLFYYWSLFIFPLVLQRLQLSYSSLSWLPSLIPSQIKLPSCSSTYIGPLIPKSTIATATPTSLWQFAQIIHTYFWFHLTNWTSFLSSPSPLPSVSLSYPASPLASSAILPSRYVMTLRTTSIFSFETSPFVCHFYIKNTSQPKHRGENELDATECFIPLIIR